MGNGLHPTCYVQLIVLFMFFVLFIYCTWPRGRQK